MKLKFIIFLLTTSNYCVSQFLEPGFSIGLNSYSGDIERGYSLKSSSPGFEIFNRFNISSHQSFKISYKILAVVDLPLVPVMAILVFL